MRSCHRACRLSCFGTGPVPDYWPGPGPDSGPGLSLGSGYGPAVGPGSFSGLSPAPDLRPGVVWQSWFQFCQRKLSWPWPCVRTTRTTPVRPFIGVLLSLRTESACLRGERTFLLGCSSLPSVSCIYFRPADRRLACLDTRHQQVGFVVPLASFCTEPFTRTSLLLITGFTPGPSSVPVASPVVFMAGGCAPPPGGSTDPRVLRAGTGRSPPTSHATVVSRAGAATCTYAEVACSSGPIQRGQLFVILYQNDCWRIYAFLKQAESVNLIRDAWRQIFAVDCRKIVVDELYLSTGIFACIEFNIVMDIKKNTDNRLIPIF